MTATGLSNLESLDGNKCVLLSAPRVLAESGTTDAVLLAGERIQAIGHEARQAAADAPRHTCREISLPGLVVAPGFIDAHTHLVHQGFGLARPELGDLSSSADVLARVAAALERHDPDRALIGEHWDDGAWMPGDRLTREALDRLAPRTPVILRRVCGHKAIANSVALDRLAADPRGARYATQGFVEATTGEILEDAAMRLAELFPPGADEVAQALELALAHAARLGVTSAHDIVNRHALRAQMAARARGALTLRITAYVPLDHLPALEMLGIMSGLGDQFFRLGGVKLFLDGSMGARTAALRNHYADRPDTCGTLLIDEETLTPLLRRLDALGMTAAMHAIGDRAIAAALAALEDLGSEQVRARGHRLEHLELLPDDLLARMARSGAIASMQPNFVARWAGSGGMYERAVGPARLAAMNRFRSLLQRGVPLAFGSDSMPMGPFLGLAGAVNHPIAAERLSPVDALLAYTRGGTCAARQDQVTGVIAAGRLADLVVIQGDPLDGGRLENCRVAATIVGGRTVFADHALLATTQAGAAIAP